MRSRSRSAFPLVTGGAVRYWLYSPAGLTAGNIASLTIVAGITFWLGMGLIVGVGFISSADAVAEIDHFHPLANQLIGLSAIGLLDCSISSGSASCARAARRSSATSSCRARC